MTRVSVVIPSWNGRHLLPFCLDPLLQQKADDVEVLVVDNGSTDGTKEWLDAEYPHCECLALPANAGFAGTVNSGLAASDAPFVLVLNNDAALRPGYIQALTAYLESHPTVGACQGRVLCHHDPAVVDSLGIRVGRAVSAFQIGRGQPDGDSPTRPREIPGVTACAALYRREALDAVADPGDPPAVFDPMFFAYYEDVDLALRLRAAGWSAYLVPSVACEHIGSATGRQGSMRKSFLLSRNYLLYLSRHVGGFGLLRLAPWLVLQHLKQLLIIPLRPRGYLAWLGGQLAAIPLLRTSFLKGRRDRRRWPRP